jgi:hypothetical protein
MDKFALIATLSRRHPNVEVINANLGERSDGEIYQSVSYRGTREQLLASALATERMFAIQPAHWRTPETTEFGCGYSLFCLDHGKDVWELSVYSGATPRDGHGNVSFLSKKSLQETGALLRRIFSTDRTDA